MTRAVALPVLLVIVLFGWVGPSPLFGFAFALVLLPALVVRARAEATALGETLLCLVVAVAMGAAISALVPRVPPHGTLKAGWAALAGGALAVVLVRFWLATPRGGVGVTLAISVLALAFCGGVQSGLLFPAFVLLFFVSAAWASRRADVARAPLRAWRRYRLAALIMALCGVVVGGFWMLSLPSMHDWVVMKIMQRRHNSVGFSDRLQLGALDGLLESEKVVLRVHGEGVDHLRGISYSHYFLGRWKQVQEDRAKPQRFPTVRPVDSYEIEMTTDEPRYYFLPIGARDVSMPSGVALRNRSNVISPLAAEPSDRLWFRMSQDTPSGADPPVRGDLELTWRVMRRLQPLAREWTKGAKNVEQSLAMLETRLKREATYSLHVEPREGVDPVVDFVLRGKRGHCEYFASAMAIMARTLGIPTRMVGGYRVSERNPWGGYWLVRERDAHTWVEAWVPERGWHSYDPTPADEQALEARASTPALQGIFDAMASGWSSFVAWLIQRSWVEVVTPLVALVMLFFGVRFWRTRSLAGGDGVGSALVGFSELSAALERLGVKRRSDETLRDYSRRLPPLLPEELASAVADSLQRYAALRYGGYGERDVIDDELRALGKRLRSRSRLAGLQAR